MIKLSNQATVTEAQGRILARVADDLLSRCDESERGANGADLHTGVPVSRIEECDAAAVLKTARLGRC